jgi:hypothetical protein
LGKLDLSCNLLPLHESTSLHAWLGRQRLVSLSLGLTPLGPQGLRLLGDCPGLNHLIDLNLNCAVLGGAVGAEVLATAPWLGGVVALDLHATRIGPDGLAALLNSGRLGRLIDLDLCMCDLGDRGARLLAEWPGLAGLMRLNLSQNDIGEAGGAALAGSPHLPAGLGLTLGDNALSEAAVARLRERLGGRLVLRRCCASDVFGTGAPFAAFPSQGPD